MSVSKFFAAGLAGELALAGDSWWDRVKAALALSEASAKVRTGPPLDDQPDYALDIWAGVIPISLTKGEPIEDLHR